MNTLSQVVVARDLTQVFPSENKKGKDINALQDLNITVKAGQLTALVGPDGAGKTTFLRLVAGLYQPSSGSLEVLGIDVAKDPQSVQDRISYMPQRFGLYEDLSIQLAKKITKQNKDIKIYYGSIKLEVFKIFKDY